MKGKGQQHTIITEVDQLMRSIDSQQLHQFIIS